MRFEPIRLYTKLPMPQSNKLLKFQSKNINNILLTKKKPTNETRNKRKVKKIINLTINNCFK